MAFRSTPVVLSEEVRQALSDGSPVVALESSVIAQGLPSPQNLENARACEAAVRANGAIPATTAVIDGVIRAGLTDAELERLGRRDPSLVKVGDRDLSLALAKRLTGGTTVSATCQIAAWTGIRVFATGGIGGVHRGAEQTFDLSQDLAALSRYPVAVVCAGAKAILDLPKTLEALETLSVPVLGVRCSEFPAFYSRSSGLLLEHRVESAEEGAAVMAARFDVLEQGGLLFALPPPEREALPLALVEAHLEEALAEAKRANVSAKAVTPFLLGKLSAKTGGATMAVNLALLRNNAAFAGLLAAADAQLRSEP